jgi:hypothetical protein
MFKAIYEVNFEKLKSLHLRASNQFNPDCMRVKTIYALIFLLFPLTLGAQQFYSVSGGEMIFQSAIVDYKNGDAANTNLRYSSFFHFGEFIHHDFGDHVGIFSGIGMRNVGFIREEQDVKTKYRSYNLGVPLALKAGSFSRNLYFFGGAEYEWMFHFKQKVFDNGDKIKYNRWFSNRTPAFIPSVFAGFQFPAGMQLKFRYYLDNFLNNKYKGNGNYSDYTNFDHTRVWYISVSYMIRNNRIRESVPDQTEIADL